LSVFFNVAYQSFLPSLMEREHLVEGNSKLAASSSIAEMGGPPAGGGNPAFCPRLGSLA